MEIKDIQMLAEKIFSPKNSKKIEVIRDPSLLTIRVYKRKALEGLAGWFSIVEIKRFYELCQNEYNILFRFPWEMTSIEFENKDYIEIYYHLI